MKNLTIRPIAVLALIGILGFGIPAVAVADTTTTTTTSTVAPVVLTFSQQIAAWHKAVAAYEKSRLTIFRAYNASVRADTKALVVALKAAHTKASQKAALTTFHAAIRAAKNVKIAALLTLGPAPVRPTR